MKKIFLFALLASLSLLEAKMVDGIALIVEGEPITTAEVRAVSTQMHVPRKSAVNILIQDRLQKYAMKDILIPEEDIDTKISQIAALNKISLAKMKKILAQQGTPWTTYRENIRKSMKKNVFFQKKVLSSIPTPSQNELKHFYAKHKKLFTTPSRIIAQEYMAKSKKNIDLLLSTGKRKQVTSKKVTLSTKTMEPSLLNTLLATPNGRYTHAMNTGNTYIAYKVLSKQGKRNMSYDASQEAIARKWKETQQGKALKDYFEKLKTRANIQYLR